MSLPAVWPAQVAVGSVPWAWLVAGLALGLLGGLLLGRTRLRRESKGPPLDASTFDALFHAALLFDLRGRVVEVNHLAEETFGRSRTELLGREVTDLFGPRHHKDLLLDPRTVDRSGPPWDRPRQLDARGLRADGEEFPASVHLRVVGEGDEVVCLAVVRDLTEKQMVEERLARHARDLARYTRELERSNKDLQQFAYIASHDLREPLRMVRGYLDLLERRHGDELDDEAREFMDYALDGAQRMDQLIRGLLAYSRVRTEARPIEPTDTGEALETALANLTMSIDEHDASVTWDDLPTVPADRDQLVQVLQNLVGNAIKHRRDEVAPEVHVGVEEGEEAWHFSVRDNGQGIPEEELERIFDIFQRGGGRRHEEGSGIGLAVCKRIVERHGGRIWAESTEGEGSTFHFTLPYEGPTEEQDVVEPEILETVEREAAETLTDRAQELV